MSEDGGSPGGFDNRNREGASEGVPQPQREESRKFLRIGRRGVLRTTAVVAGLATMAGIGVKLSESGGSHQGGDKSHSRVIDNQEEIAHGVGYDSDVQALGLSTDVKYVVNPEQVAYSFGDVLNSINTVLNNVEDSVPTGQQFDIPLSSGDSLVSALNKYKNEGQSGMREHLVRTVETDPDGLYGQGNITTTDNLFLGNPNANNYEGNVVGQLTDPDIKVTTTYDKNIENNGIEGTQDASTYSQAIDFNIDPEGKIIVGGTGQDIHLSRQDALNFAQSLGLTEITAETDGGLVFAGAYNLQVNYDGSAELRTAGNYLNKEDQVGPETGMPNPDKLTQINSQSQLLAALALNLSQQSQYSAKRDDIISSLSDLSAASKKFLITINNDYNTGGHVTGDPSVPALNAYVAAGKVA